MQMGTTGKGNMVLLVNENVYLSFGTDTKVKWIHLSYPIEKGGARCGELFRPDLTGLTTEGKKVLGKDNMKLLKTVFKKHVVDGVIDRKDLLKIGAEIELKGL